MEYYEGAEIKPNVGRVRVDVESVLEHLSAQTV